jgi:hypothetical protein
VSIILLGSVTTYTRATVILGVEGKDIRVRFRNTEGLVTITGRIVADKDMVFVISTWIIN